MPQHSIQLCRDGAEANHNDRFRKGNVIHLPDAGQVIVAGDLHGHTRNFERIRTLADLKNNPDTHVILQEIIHGGPEDDYGGCLSWRLLFEAIRYKLEFPDQVHIILGNHDTAAISNSSVLKGGKEMNRAMQEAMQRHFDKHYQNVYDAMCEYMLSQPLAVRCANRIWLSHSLPANQFVDQFDPSIFERDCYTMDDIEKPNSVYLLTWGRRQSPETLTRMAEMLDVDVFILGHQPQENGWSLVGPNTVIIASEHNFGCLLKFDLSETYTPAGLAGRIIPLSSIA